MSLADMLAPMDWQELAALSIVAVTAAILGWSRLRPRKFSFERDTHCGCGSPSDSSNPSIIFHARKGEPPRVRIKMK